MIWTDARVTALDLETSGVLPEYALQPWRMRKKQMWVTSASALYHDGQELSPMLSQLFPTPEQIYAMLRRIKDEGRIALGWNICFDISVLMAFGPEFEQLCMEIQWLDGMLLWRHLEIEPEYEFSNAKHKKKSYALKPGGVAQWIPQWVGLDEEVDFHATDPESLAKLQAYNDRDNVRCWVISKMIWDKLSEGPRRAAVIEAESLPMVAQANLHGIKIDRLAVSHLAARQNATAAAKLAALAPFGMTETIVRSPTKLGNLLFDDWKLPVLKTNKSKVEGKEDSRSTDKEVLHELAFIDPRAKHVKEYREALNNASKFCGSITNSINYNEDGDHTHPIAALFSTYTGRQTVSSKQGRGVKAVPIGFALHQMKRDAEFREVLEADEGYVILEFDAAGQEFRWMAIASGDQTMLDLCMPGEDAHSFMGAQIVGVDYRQLVKDFHDGSKSAKQNRYLGKFANLSLQYRTSPRKLRIKARVDYDIPLELPESQRIHKTYQRAYPGVPRYWSTQIELVKQLGYVETFGGRRINVVGDWSGSFGWSMGSTAINARIQGTGACQKYLAMKYVKPIIQRYNARFLFDLHDGLYLLAPAETAMKLAHELKEVLDNLPYREEWGFTPPIPLPWDAKIGPNWGALKDVEFN